MRDGGRSTLIYRGSDTARFVGVFVGWILARKEMVLQIEVVCFFVGYLVRKGKGKAFNTTLELSPPAAAADRQLVVLGPAACYLESNLVFRGVPFSPSDEPPR